MEYKKNSFLGLYGTANYGDRPLVSSSQRGDAHRPLVIRELFHFYLAHSCLFGCGNLLYFSSIPLPYQIITNMVCPQANERYFVWSPWWWEIGQDAVDSR